MASVGIASRFGRRSNSYGGEAGLGLDACGLGSLLDRDSSSNAHMGSVQANRATSVLHGAAGVVDVPTAAALGLEEDEDEDEDYDAYFRFDPAAKRRMTSTAEAVAARREIEVQIADTRPKAKSDACTPSPVVAQSPAVAPVDRASRAEIEVAPVEDNTMRRRNSSMDWIFNGVQLSRAQQQGCFKYMKRRHSVALAFASENETRKAKSKRDSSSSPTAEDERPPSNISPLDAILARDSKTSASAGDEDSIWEFSRVKHGVRIFKSTRSRCEVRASTQVNASVKHVMSLLAASPSTMGAANESAAFIEAQRILLGSDQILEARVLASCVPSTSGFFHCGLKYAAIKNPFGSSSRGLDLVYLDYTDVVTLETGQSVGFRVVESIRIPGVRPVPPFTRASIRCEVYIVRESPGTPGVVQVTYAAHVDPKSKLAPRATSHYQDLAALRLANLRAYAEKRSFALRVRTGRGRGGQASNTADLSAHGSSARHFPRPARCCVCQHKFSLLRKRHSCRVCGDASCGRCCRKVPVLVDARTSSRVKVCLGCMLEARANPDGGPQDDEDADSAAAQLAGRQRTRTRGDLSNSTFVIQD